LNLIPSFLRQKKQTEISYQENNALARALYSLFRSGNTVFYEDNPKEYITKGYSYNPHARTVVDYIAENVSTLEFKVMEVVGDELIPTKEEFILDFLRCPNESQTFKEFVFAAVAFKKITGNNFIFGLAPTGFPDTFFTKGYNMPSQNVEIVQGSWMNPVRGYTLLIDSSKTEIEASKVYHRKTFNPNSDEDGKSVYGLSPMSSLRRSLQRSNESYDASLGMMQNGAPIGILTPKDGSVSLTAGEMERAEKTFKEKYGSGKNKGKVFQSSVPVNWQSVGLSPADMQVLESNTFDLQDFCRVYQISSVLVSDNDKSTYNNVSEAEKRFWQNVAIPEAEDLRQALQHHFASGWQKQTGKEYKFVYSTDKIPALQDDLDTLSKRLLDQVKEGIITPKQMLEMLGQPYEDRPELDILRTPKQKEDVTQK